MGWLLWLRCGCAFLRAACHCVCLCLCLWPRHRCPFSAAPLAFMCVSVRQRESGRRFGGFGMWQDSSAQCPPSGCRKSHSRSQSQSQRCCSWRRRGQTQRLGLTGINVIRPILPFCRCTLCGSCMPAPNTPPPPPRLCCHPPGKLLKTPFKSWHRCMHLRLVYDPT